MADETDRLGVDEEREASDRAGHQGREALEVGRQRLRRMLPGHAVDPAHRGLGLIAAEEHAAMLTLAIDKVVWIPETGHLGGQLVTRHGTQGDVLVVHGGRWDERPDHRGHLRRPDTGSIDGQLRLDRTCLGFDVRHRAPFGEPEAGHAQPCPDAHAEGLGRGRHRMRGSMRVEVPVLSHPDTAVERLVGDRGQVRLRLGG